MKSIYKRLLLIGLSMSLVALAGMQLNADEIEGEPDEGDPEPDTGGVIPFPQTSQARELLKYDPVLTAAMTVTFSGKLVRSDGKYALQEVGGTLYLLDSITRPLPELGEEVRVTGKLDLSRNVMHVDEIEAFDAAPVFLRRASAH